jgi:hypothetical protein
MDFSKQTDLLNYPKLAIPEYLLIEKIERAFKQGGLKIEDLFLVVPVSERNSEGEIFLETKYGKLRTFFVNELFEFHRYDRSIPKALLLSAKKFNYPKISKISTRNANKIILAKVNN